MGHRSREISGWISSRVLQEFSKNQNWLKAMPILLGSWARQELCLKSDLDILFIGPEEFVAKLVQEFSERGIKLRYRVPKNRQDWTEGVEAWDLMALYKAEPLVASCKKDLLATQEKIFTSLQKLKTFQLAIRNERRQRLARFDSIQNFLEPNLKYGPGGLRDLYQGLLLLDFYPAEFSNATYERDLLLYYREFFLLIRHWLHQRGSGGDILSGNDQLGLSQWFGYKKLSDFMRDVQKGLSRVSFYTNWIVAQSGLRSGLARSVLSRNEARIGSSTKPLRPPQLKGLYRELKSQSDILAEHSVRRRMDKLKKTELTAVLRGYVLRDLFAKGTKEEVLVSVFHSRLIDKLIPRFKRLVGYVQHDQYHRYTADAHILQACREVKKIWHQPRNINALASIAGSLTAKDWQILSWTAFYHDLAKGLEGDHSSIGEEWVLKDLKSFGLEKSVRQEVAWLVRNHLQLSIAAFRKNPALPQTWKDLWALDLNAKRLHRLAVFTAIDIRATNPEAWSDWKGRLLAQLVGQLLQGGTQNYLRVSAGLPKNFPLVVLEKLDPQIFSEIPTRKLQADLLQVWTTKQSSILVVAKTKRYYWVRFARQHDAPGLLADFVGRIFGVGGSIRHALIHTSDELGVYDWFYIESNRSPEVLVKMLALTHTATAAPVAVRFQSLELVSQSATELVLSLKGTDQKGMIYAASRALFELGANITSARAHTWGRQVEDLFSIKRPENLNNFLQALSQRLLG